MFVPKCVIESLFRVKPMDKGTGYKIEDKGLTKTAALGLCRRPLLFPRLWHTLLRIHFE